MKRCVVRSCYFIEVTGNRFCVKQLASIVVKVICVCNFNILSCAVIDSIDTRTALEALRDLVTAANKYIESLRTSETGPNAHLLKNIAQYITKIVSVRTC